MGFTQIMNPGFDLLFMALKELFHPLLLQSLFIMGLIQKALLVPYIKSL